MSEVLRDLVVSLSLDGDNFSRNLTSINKQIQEAESEFRRAASGVDNFEKSVSGTQSQLSSLQQKLALQQKAVKQYEKALEAANKKLENAYARQGRLTESLDAAKQKNADLRQQVAAATKQYERFSRELGESDSATLAAKANLDALSQEYADSTAEVKKLEGQLAANTKSLQNNLEAALNAAFVIHSPSQRVRPIGENVAAGVGEGMADYDLSADAEALAEKVKAALETALPADALTAFGNSAVEGLSGALIGYSMATTGSSVATNIKSAVSGSLNASTLRPVGVNAMAGLKAGILAGRSGVISAMRSAARDAVNAAKRELKIKSPSGVFRDEVGRMAMRGFGQGALLESKNQAKVIQNAARYLTGVAQGGIGGANSYDNRKTYNQNASTIMLVARVHGRRPYTAEHHVLRIGIAVCVDGILGIANLHQMAQIPGMGRAFEVFIAAHEPSPPLLKHNIFTHSTDLSTICCALLLASEHLLGIAIGIQQAVKRHPHGLVGGHVGNIPILIVETCHKQNRQPHRLGRGIGKLRPAVILRRGLRL